MLNDPRKLEAAAAVTDGTAVIPELVWGMCAAFVWPLDIEAVAEAREEPLPRAPAVGDGTEVIPKFVWDICAAFVSIFVEDSWPLDNESAAEAKAEPLLSDSKMLVAAAAVADGKVVIPEFVWGVWAVFVSIFVEDDWPS